VRNAALSFVAGTWLVHGLYNKLLGGAPRHLAIVQAVPGLAGAAGEYMLAAVGVFEVALAAWILSRRAPRLCAATQTAVLLSMNLVELSFARHLLLWPAGLIPVNLVFLAVAWSLVPGPRSSVPGPQSRVGRRSPVGPWSLVPGRLRTRLRRHPIPIQAHFRHCLTLTYALPADALLRLLPPGLELDTLDGHGFVAVALVQTESLRPAGLPRAVGQDFFFAGYRVFTRFRTPEGRVLRGLRILRSDTDRTRMMVGGNLLTHYNYHRCEATVDASGARLRVAVRTPDRTGDLDVTADLSDAALPDGSPFPSPRHARRFAGPMPFTFDYEQETHAIVVIKANRTNWSPAAVRVDVGHISFFDQPVFAACTPVLAAAFHVPDVDYRWERGVHVPLPASTGKRS